VNFGIVPLTFVRQEDYDDVQQGDVLEVLDLRGALARQDSQVTVRNVTKNRTFTAAVELTRREADIILAGGLLNYTRLH
jgi:aconitate hydratase